jgi:hypothetical protein
MPRTVIQLDKSVKMACLYVEGQLLASLNYDEFKLVGNKVLCYTNGDYCGAFLFRTKEGIEIPVEEVNAGCSAQL